MKINSSEYLSETKVEDIKNSECFHLRNLQNDYSLCTAENKTFLTKETSHALMKKGYTFGK